jgi:hypothetical protein
MGVAKPMKRLIKAPGKKVLILYNGLPKPYTSIIMQLRTGRSALNHFLFKIKQHPDGQCSCKEGLQTPKHVVLECSRWGDLWRQMFTKIAARTELSPVQANDWDSLISDPKAVRFVAEFVLNMGLLG